MKFATLGTLALTLTTLLSADAQAFGRKKRAANNACCPTVPSCSSYGSHGGGYGHAGWSGAYASGGCGYGSYAMTQGMPGQAFGYAGDPNAASGYAYGQTQGFQSGQTQPTPMPGTTGSVAGQTNQNQNQNQNQNPNTNSTTTNQNSSTGPVTVTGGTNPGSGVVQATGTISPQGMPYPQGGVQQMGYAVPATTYAAPMYSGSSYESSYGSNCGCGYATADVGRSGRRGLFRR